MDPLSAGASALAFIGLAGKLGSGLLKVYETWSLIEDAPEYIRTISKDIFHLSVILNDIATEEEQLVPHEPTRAVLQECSEVLDKLKAVVDDLGLGLAASNWRRRKWSSVKVVLTKERTRKLQASLTELKLSLCLSLNSSLSQKLRRQHEDLCRGLSVPHAIKDEWTLTVSCSASDLKAITNEATIVLRSVQNPVLRAGLSQLLSKAAQTQEHDTLPTDDDSEGQVERGLVTQGTVSIVPTAAKSQPGHSALGSKFRIVTTERRPTHSWTGLFGTVLAEKVAILATQKRAHNTDLLRRDCYTSITLRPSRWLTSLGVRYESIIKMSLSTGLQLDLSNSTIRTIPSNSPIFEHCKQGNLVAVRTMLSQGEASINDADDWGRTLLHFSAEGYHVELCQFLLDAGTQATFDSTNICPLTMALHGSNYRRFRTSMTINNYMEPCDNQGRHTVSLTSPAYNTSVNRQIDTQTVLMKARPEEFAFVTLVFLVSSYFHARAWPKNPDFVVFGTLLRSSATLKSDLEYLTDKPDYLDIARRLWAKTAIWEKSGQPSNLDDDYDEVLDKYAIERRSPSVAHSYVAALKSPFDIATLAAQGANLHGTARSVDTYYWSYPRTRPPWDTPTSLSMFSSDGFWRWRKALVTSGVDLEDFIQQELGWVPEPKSWTGGGSGGEHNEKMPLLLSKWNKAALAQLFAHEFVPSSCNHVCRCRRRDQGPILKQPQWLKLLYSIKRLQFGSEVGGLVSNLKETFCMPDHQGCYLCEYCWVKSGYKDNFYTARELDPSLKAIRGRVELPGKQFS